MHVLTTTRSPLTGLFSESNMPWEIDRRWPDTASQVPSLSEMAISAVQVISELAREEGVPCMHTLSTAPVPLPHTGAQLELLSAEASLAESREWGGSTDFAKRMLRIAAPDRATLADMYISAARIGACVVSRLLIVYVCMHMILRTR